ncbi:MAG: hypothetical protein HKN70_10870 [Gammaproteobacteria bacterium]|nr:hypothetical protein [Gammaproteobacteria bacterium]
MKNKRINCGALGLCIMICCSVTASAQQQAPSMSFGGTSAQPIVEGVFDSSWQSRYFSEGRDSLAGDSLWVNSIDLAWNKLLGQVWYATSPQQAYDELQLFIGFGHSVGEVDLYVGYGRLEFPADKLHDTEASAGISWPGLPGGAEITVDATYAFAANGWFYDVAVRRSFAVSDALSVHAIGNFGVNQGFVSDGHGGGNHFMLHGGAEYLLSEAIAVTAYAAYTWAVNEDMNLAGDMQLTDFFHGGIGVRWYFH